VLHPDLMGKEPQLAVAHEVVADMGAGEGHFIKNMAGSWFAVLP